MPFKIRLKKSRQYNVVSKNLFVISVELLDRSVIECTMSSESTGQDCLSNVCQRVGLHQPDFFGLRFVYKRHGLRWVEMGKPLKKQLEKHASEFKLYLAVMFYIMDVGQLHDEVTRYQYFLQLKKDIIEGHLPCTAERAVLLTSYCLQAEFGNHDPERHTVEYLKEFVLFPKHMTTDRRKLEELLSEVLQAHGGLQGLTPSAAEIHYIQNAQHLEGYGYEFFTAKDDSGNEVLLGVSVLGIIAKYQNAAKTQFYNWSTISNLTHHKRYLVVECENEGNTYAQYQLEDSEVAKYVWKLCIQQNKFYVAAKCLFSQHNCDEVNETDWRSHSLPNLQNSVSHNPLFETVNSTLLIYNQESQILSDPQQDTQYGHGAGVANEVYRLTPSYSGTNLVHAGSAFSIDSAGGHQSHPNGNATRSSSLGLSSTTNNHHLHQPASNPDLRKALLPSYRPAPDYETAVQQKYGAVPLATSSATLNVTSGVVVGESCHPPPASVATSQSYDSALDTFANRVGHPGLAVNGHMTTAVQQQQQHQQQRAPPIDAKNYSHYRNFDDLAHLDEETDGGPAFAHRLTNGYLGGAGLSGGGTGQSGGGGGLLYPHHYQYHQLASGQQQQLQQQMHHPLLQHQRLSEWNTAGTIHHALPPPSHTYSTPELTSRGLVQDPAYEDFIRSLQALNHFKPPPPYPYAPRSSSSTPDLAGGNVPTILEAGRQQQQQQLSRPFDHLVTSPAEVLEPENHSSYQTAARGQFLNRGIGESLSNGLVPHSAASASDSGATAGLVHSGSNKSHVVQALNEDLIRNLLPSLSSNNLLEQSSNWNGGSVPSGSSSRSSSIQSGSDAARQPSPSLPKHRAPKAPSNAPPLLLAAMNGLSLSHSDLVESALDDTGKSNKDTRCQALENKLAEGSVFGEFEQISKKRANAEYTCASLAENAPRNRFKDVLPYEDNRVRLTPTKDNKHGYINASHISVTAGQQQRFYIAAQGPLANTAASFWQMVWEQNAQIIIMLTEVKEQGKEKCFPYWPQEENGKLDFGEYQVVRKFSSSANSYITCSLTLQNTAQKKQRNVWHIQYTDWPDHGCPEDVHGFLSFMEEIDSVRRHAASEIPPGKSRNLPMVVHCSAGVGRSGVTILCDVMIYCLDHNEAALVPKVLTLLREQRMLTVQTVAQYKFVYSVLIQYLKNSRLI